jgi:hypothetical protein
MPDLPCRVTRLEVKLDNETEDSKEFRAEIRHALLEISDSVQVMKMQREKQVGFIAGVSAVIGILVAAVGYIFNKFYQ